MKLINLLISSLPPTLLYQRTLFEDLKHVMNDSSLNCIKFNHDKQILKWIKVSTQNSLYSPINKYCIKFSLTATAKLADEVIIVFDTPWLKNNNYWNLFLVCHYLTLAKVYIPVSQFKNVRLIHLISDVTGLQSVFQNLLILTAKFSINAAERKLINLNSFNCHQLRCEQEKTFKLQKHFQYQTTIISNIKFF